LPEITLPLSAALPPMVVVPALAAIRIPPSSVPAPLAFS
jgi:hypothetical protein